MGFDRFRRKVGQTGIVSLTRTLGRQSEQRSDPGRQMYLQRTHTATLGSGKGLTGVEVRSTFNCSASSANGEVKGGEFKGRHTTGNAFTIGTLKGLIGNADAKNGTVTTARAVEASIDIAAGGTVTTATGLRGYMNNSGTATTSYGCEVAAETAGKWTYGLYMTNVVRAIYTTAALTGSSALNAVGIDVTDSTTLASGYAHGIHVGYTKSGTDTGSGSSTLQYNAIGIDYTISGDTTGAGFNGFYLYLTKSGSPTLTNAQVGGALLEMIECGATDYFFGLGVNKYNTTAGTARDCFLLLQNQASGVTTSGIIITNVSTTNFVHCTQQNGGFMDNGGTAGDVCIGHMRLLLGSQVAYINVYSDNS